MTQLSLFDDDPVQQEEPVATCQKSGWQWHRPPPVEEVFSPAELRELARAGKRLESAAEREAKRFQKGRGKR